MFHLILVQYKDYYSYNSRIHEHSPVSPLVVAGGVDDGCRAALEQVVGGGVDVIYIGHRAVHVAAWRPAVLYQPAKYMLVYFFPYYLSLQYCKFTYDTRWSWKI